MNQQRFPSVVKLMEVFNDEATALMARKVMEMSRGELLRTDAGRFRANECLNPPPLNDLRMYVMNSLDPGLFGIETEEIKSEYFDYLNAGDAYNPTVILWRGKFRVQDVATFRERNERLVRNEN
jgi:hypothetical protein